MRQIVLQTYIVPYLMSMHKISIKYNETITRQTLLRIAFKNFSKL